MTNSSLIPQLIKQVPDESLKLKVRLHCPEWFNLEEADAINILKLYSVDKDINEVNNLELLSTVQEEKEGIRAYVARLEFKSCNCQLEHDVKCPRCYHEFKSEAAELVIQQAMLTNMKDKSI